MPGFDSLMVWLHWSLVGFRTATAVQVQCQCVEPKMRHSVGRIQGHSLYLCPIVLLLYLCWLLGCCQWSGSSVSTWKTTDWQMENIPLLWGLELWKQITANHMGLSWRCPGKGPFWGDRLESSCWRSSVLPWPPPPPSVSVTVLDTVHTNHTLGTEYTGINVSHAKATTACQTWTLDKRWHICFTANEATLRDCGPRLVLDCIRLLILCPGYWWHLPAVDVILALVLLLQANWLTLVTPCGPWS